MKYQVVILAIFTLLVFNSCGNQDTNSLVNCEKLTSRADAEELMLEVKNNRFTESSKILENLIGDWVLIGMVPGWVGFETGQKCIKLKITSNTVELEDIDSDSTSIIKWKLLPFEVNGYSGFYLDTNEPIWENRIGIDVFSEKIMYGAGRADDTNTYIYEKLN